MDGVDVGGGGGYWWIIREICSMLLEVVLDHYMYFFQTILQRSTQFSLIIIII